jgi:hypothetical protein
VQLNLPGDTSYQPGLPWVCKLRSSDGKNACDFAIYVDDVRSGGNSWMEARLVGHAIAMAMNYLGLQDAARKRRDPSQNPGPWAGSVIHVDDGIITVTVTQERWEKASNIIDWIHDSMELSHELDFKILESYQGI